MFSFKIINNAALPEVRDEAYKKVMLEFSCRSIGEAQNMRTVVVSHRNIDKYFNSAFKI